MRGSPRATGHEPPGTAKGSGSGDSTAAAADVWGVACRACLRAVRAVRDVRGRGRRRGRGLAAGTWAAVQGAARVSPPVFTRLLSAPLLGLLFAKRLRRCSPWLVQVLLRVTFSSERFQKSPPVTVHLGCIAL